MATSWAKAVGDCLRDHYVRSKGRDPAQGEFALLMNMRMQSRRPEGWTGDARAVEALRRELEPLVVADVRQKYPTFSPECWSLWESWEARGYVRESGAEVEVLAFERNRGASRVRFRRLPPPDIAIAPGEMPPRWPLEECDVLDFTPIDA